MREIVNGSFEPLWRRNARRDADTFKSELMRAAPSRRAFLAGSGAALLLEYMTQRRAVAFPFPHGGAASSVTATGITNQRTGTIYQYLPNALAAMVDGDTLLLPAGPTYQHSGTTYYYQDWHNFPSELRLGTTGFRGITGSDYGSIQGVGSANNGRAMISPPYGILAADFLASGSPQEMFLDLSTPVTCFNPAGVFNNLVVNNASLGSAFAWFNMSYTGVNIGNNSLTGVTGNSTGTIPAGTVVSMMPPGFKGIFTVTGQNPGWTFTNLEIAYGNGDYSTAEVTPIFQYGSVPDSPFVGSMTVNNCYLHDCRQGVGLGYSGIGNDMPTFARFFDTEITQIGDNSGQTHNMYIGHMGELLMDNCYSHRTAGTWLVKSRAALNILRNCQIRGELTGSYNPFENDGCDFSTGGLTYLIGNIHQQSLNPANYTINYAAELHLFDEGAIVPTQELYVINCTFVGPAGGTAAAPIRLYGVPYNLSQPQVPSVTKLSQSSSGSQAARRYWVACTNTGASGGETRQAPFADNVGASSVSDTLSIDASKVMTVHAPNQATGTASWNCYANYGDPALFCTLPGNYDPAVDSYFFWDIGQTQPVFSRTSGGTLISVSGTLTNGSGTISAVSGLTGLATIKQLVGFAISVDGTQFATVRDADTTANTLTIDNAWTGTTGSGHTIQFGWAFWCGFTYQTALGDSVNYAMANSGENIRSWSLSDWYDGSYTLRSGFVNAAPVVLLPGQKLIVNAPPSGPSWAPSGVNFWAQFTPFAYDWLHVNAIIGDAGLIGLAKQNSTPIGYGTSWTSPASVFSNGERLQPNLYLQNASPLSFGSNFVEPDTGLVNNNPTAGKLEWFRRAAHNNDGRTMDCWYAVVPIGGLSGYSETMYLCNNTGISVPTVPTAACHGSVGVWRGCAASIFDANFPIAACSYVNPISVSTASGNVAVLAAIRGTGTAGATFTQISASSGYMNAEYKASAGVVSNLSVAQTGGLSNDMMIVDALVGSGSPPSLITTATISGTGPVVTFTIASANEGDVLYLMLGEDSVSNVSAIGAVGPPPVGNAVGISPICLIQNCLSANFNPTSTGGWTCTDDGSSTTPVGHVTVTTSLQANPYNGATFGAPLWATVFASSVQADFDYRLAVASPAKSAASNPGSSPEGQDLVPHYQVNWQGLPTPGTPIPAKAARTDIGPALTGSIGALT